MVIDKEYIGKRIRLVRKSLGLTQAEFCEKINIKQPNLSDYEQGKVMPEGRTLNDILSRLNVNREWFFDNRGGMFSQDAPRLLPSPQTPLQTYFSYLPEKDSDSYIPYYDVEVTAGKIELFFDDADEQPEGYIYAPQFKNCISCNVKGDSMYDKILPGSRLYIYRLPNLKYIDFGQIYLIVLDGYRLLKYIVPDPTNENRVILRSYNRHYDDWKVDRADILHLFLVKGYENQNAN